MADEDWGQGDQLYEPNASPQDWGHGDQVVHTENSWGKGDQLAQPNTNDPRNPYGQSTQPETTSPGVAAREFARGVIPTVVGAGAGLGAGILAAPSAPFTAGVGPAAAGLAAAAAVGAGTSYLQNKITDALGLDSPESRAQDIAEHPTAALVGGLAPAVVTFQPGKIGTAITQRFGTAAILGGVDVGQQLVTKGKVDPTEAAASAATGFILPKPYGYIERAGRAVAGALGAKAAATSVNRSGVSTGDIDPTLKAGAEAANPPGAEEAPTPPPPTQTQPAPAAGSPPEAQQAMQTSQARAPMAPAEPAANEGFNIPPGGVDIGGAAPAEPIGQAERSTVRTPAQKILGPELPEGYKLDEPPAKIGAPGVDGQNENIQTTTPAEDEAIARMKPPPEGEAHSLGAAAGAQSELPEAPPPLFSGRQWTPPEETANRMQEYARVEKLNRAAEAQDIMDKLKDATGKGPWSAIQAMLGRNPGNMRDIHEAVETGDLSKLTPKQREIWDKSGMSDLLDESRDWFQKEIDAGRMVDQGQTSGMPRMTDKKWLELSGQANREDPVGGDVGKRNLGTTFEPDEPPTYQMRDGKGNTQIVTETPHGFKIWDKGVPQEVIHPTELSIGTKFEHDGKNWTVEKAPMDAVEQNVKDKDGDFVKYLRSPIPGIVNTVMRQRDLARNMRALDLIKSDPAFNGMRTNSADTAKANGWVETKIPQLRGLYFDPEIASQLNSFHVPGLDMNLGKAGDAVAGINRFLTSSMFWNPVPHTLNTAAHWFVARGADWFVPSRYPGFFASSRDALREVLGNGPAYREYLKDGAPFMWPSIDAGRMVNTIGRLGEVAVQQDPNAWNQIARMMGLNTGRDLVKLWYQGARQVLWQSGDVLAMQRIMELERRGLSRNDAIQETRNHMPDYNIPYKVMGQEWLSRLMQDPRLIFGVFNRYHMGVFKSLAKIVHDSVAPGATHDDRMKAIGNALALTTLAYVVKPALDAGWQTLTGNPDAKANPRGPLAPLSAAKDFITGKKTASEAITHAWTMSPFFKAATEVFTGHDAFTGKNITEPMSPFHHQLAQAIGHAAEYVAPVKTFSGPLMPGNKGSIGHELAAQVGDFKNPTAKQKASERLGNKIRKEAAQKREKKPQNILEYGLKRMGYAEGGPVTGEAADRDSFATVTPSTPGQWSDEDEARLQATNTKLSAPPYDQRGGIPLALSSIIRKALR